MYRVYLLILWLTWMAAGSGDKLSDFHRRKLAIYFNMMDRNNDSVMEEVDFHQAAGRFFSECSLGLNENDVAYKQATIVTKAWWAFPFDKEGEGKSASHDEYWAVMPTRVKDPKYQVKLKKMFEYYFDGIDVDGDNLMSLVEFSAVLHQLRGVEYPSAKRYFDGIDTNGDNVLQREEYVTAQVDFLAGDDESKPSKWVLGPLY